MIPEINHNDTNDTVDAPDASEQEWLEIVERTDPGIRKLVATLVEGHAPVLASRFYSTMMADPAAAAFLSHQLVEDRLAQSMQRWLTALFSHYDSEKISASVALQRNVGQVHARIKLPLQLVTHSSRLFKHWIWEFLIQERELQDETLMQAVIYTNDLIDVAIEIMSSAFISSSDRSARNEEAYRLFSLSQDLAVERERQRAALMEWSQQIAYQLHRDPERSLTKLSNSEFGLWLTHKALFMFDRAAEIKEIRDITSEIDETILPRFHAELTPSELSDLLTSLEQEISQIKFLLSNLFERHMELENGRDVLTRLYNRRFLSSVLTREITLAKHVNRRFAVILIDIDHFKKVNDQYGHDAGDTALQQTAALIINNVRAGDFVFRYGGEEILVVLVDVDQEAALRIAESIRQRIAATQILLKEQRTLFLTVSIGGAVYDGHPDYRFLISQADAAMYKAKASGRNRCVFS